MKKTILLVLLLTLSIVLTGCANCNANYELTINNRFTPRNLEEAKKIPQFKRFEQPDGDTKMAWICPGEAELADDIKLGNYVRGAITAKAFYCPSDNKFWVLDNKNWYGPYEGYPIDCN
ncbi:hypothetical protein GOV04_05140 [Candidatus Woesearchaeota archaeon]|nr:hypothetical protein [Candidatus Woesearchaeota archaeon]